MGTIGFSPCCCGNCTAKFTVNNCKQSPTAIGLGNPGLLTCNLYTSDPTMGGTLLGSAMNDSTGTMTIDFTGTANTHYWVKINVSAYSSRLQDVNSSVFLTSCSGNPVITFPPVPASGFACSIECAIPLESSLTVTFGSGATCILTNSSTGSTQSSDWTNLVACVIGGQSYTFQSDGATLSTNGGCGFMFNAPTCPPATYMAGGTINNAILCPGLGTSWTITET
jgi:hypothetical protein